LLPATPLVTLVSDWPATLAPPADMAANAAATAVLINAEALADTGFSYGLS
jgi:hypothetical protein